MIKTFEFLIQDDNKERKYFADTIDKAVNGWLSEQNDIEITDIKVNTVDLCEKIKKIPTGDAMINTKIMLFYTIIYRAIGT